MTKTPLSDYDEQIHKMYVVEMRVGADDAKVVVAATRVAGQKQKTTLFSGWFFINENVFSNQSEALFSVPCSRTLDPVRLSHIL